MSNDEHLERSEKGELFLSRLLLNPHERAVRRDLADCQAMHQRILSAFGDAEAGTARAEFSVLYRVESNARTNVTTVLVQSNERPDWIHLPAHYLREGEGENPACKSVGDRYAGLRAGTGLRFRLRANPTRKVETKTLADGKRRHGKRVELRDEAEQAAWLERKAAQHGFRLRAVRFIDEDRRTGLRKSQDGDANGGGDVASSIGDKPVRPQRLTFASVLFDGELVVTDSELFVAALKGGVGTGKAYGFGLLSVAPAMDRG